MEKKIRKLFVFFDSDDTGKRDSHKIGKILAPFVKKVEIITLQHRNDPGELTLAEAETIKAGLRFNSK